MASPNSAHWLRRYRYPILGAAIAVVVAVVLLVSLLPGGGGKREAGPTRGAGLSGSASDVPSFPTRGAPSATEAKLLGARVGFGGKVTGGAGGTVVHVTTDADTGRGSLRDALSGDSPRWIVFEKNMTIRLHSALTVGSNKTIDGRGRKVEITGPNLDGLELEHVSNVIIESLTLHDFGNVAKTDRNNLPDAIHLEGARGVWIDHNDLSMAGDKLIGVSGGSSGLTVSWNHFHDQEQTFQIGNQATGSVDAKQTVTVHHNFFDRTGYRNPVISYGIAHVYNNFYLDWKLYAVRSERAGRLYLQDNVFQAGDNRRATLIKTSGNGCNDKRTRCDDRSGYLRSVGNLLLNHARVVDNQPNSVPDPRSIYQYRASTASMALADQIKSGAGPER